MAKEIKVAVAGIGNCFSSLLQGIEYYKNIDSNDELVSGLMHNVLGGYKIKDIKFVAAFDIDKRKIGKDLSEAVFEKPNCTKVFCPKLPKTGIKVLKGPVLDGVAGHMKDFPDERTFLVDEKQKPVDVVKTLKESKAEILLNYLPVGSEEAVKFYAQAALDASCGFINCMPVFIASNNEWAEKFRQKGLPVLGDDIKSQVGATIVHRTLAKLFTDRGLKINGTYQLNVGGNTDFLNMKSLDRLKSKKISKTESVQSNLPVPLEKDLIHIGPSDYVPWLYDNKLCFLRLEGSQFGDIPMNLELRLSVEDSPNSAGCVIDGIRAMKLALDRKVSGPLLSISAFIMKHPPQQFPDPIARDMIEEFIQGKRER